MLGAYWILTVIYLIKFGFLNYFRGSKVNLFYFKFIKINIYKMSEFYKCVQGSGCQLATDDNGTYNLNM